METAVVHSHKTGLHQKTLSEVLFQVLWESHVSFPVLVGWLARSVVNAARRCNWKGSSHAFALHVCVHRDKRGERRTDTKVAIGDAVHESAAIEAREYIRLSDTIEVCDDGYIHRRGRCRRSRELQGSSNASGTSVGYGPRVISDVLNLIPALHLPSTRCSRNSKRSQSPNCRSQRLPSHDRELCWDAPLQIVQDSPQPIK